MLQSSHFSQAGMETNQKSRLSLCSGYKKQVLPDSYFLDAEIGNIPSFGWRSISHGRDLLAKIIRKMVGIGESIRVWIDRWLHDRGPRVHLYMNCLIDLELRVKDLIDFSARDWNHHLLQGLFYPGDIEIITRHKPVVRKEDFYSWEHTKSGNFSVKSAYWFASQQKNPDLLREAFMQSYLNGLKNQIWSIQTMPKIKSFLWRSLSGALPISKLIRARGQWPSTRDINNAERMVNPSTMSSSHVSLLGSCGLYWVFLCLRVILMRFLFTQISTISFRWERILHYLFTIEGSLLGSYGEFGIT